jgi:hypothetical protein
MQDRIGQLESLLVSTLSASNREQSDKNQAQATEDSSQLSESFGRFSLENSETSYVESAHWTAVLDGVRCQFPPGVYLL